MSCRNFVFFPVFLPLHLTEDDPEVAARASTESAGAEILCQGFT